MMAGLLNLEAFDAAELSDTGPSEEYHKGYAAGHNAGYDAACAQADALRRDLAQTLMDISFTYNEARHDVLSSLAVLVTALTDTILPHCVAQGFARQVADLVLTRFTPGAEDGICIHVHPDQVTALQSVTDAIPGGVAVIADPTLPPHAAWIGQGQVETYLDMDAHLARISELLSNISPIDQRNTANG